MSLLEEMQQINTSGIVSARGSISVSVQADGLQGLIGGGAAQTVLGSLGDVLGQIRSLENPEALLGPIVEAVGGLRGTMSSDSLPISDFIRAVSEGIDIIVGLIEAIGDGDLSSLSLPGGKSVGDMLGEVGSQAARYAGVNLDGVDNLRTLIQTVDNGLSGNIGGIANTALDLLLPFGRAELGSIRASVDHLVNGTVAIQIPTNTTTALVAALDIVAVAAASGDSVRLNAALRDLERARQNALELIRRALAAFTGALQGLDLARHLGVIADASVVLRTGEESVLEFMARLRQMLGFIREVIEDLNPDDLTNGVNMLGDMLESGLRTAVEEPINKMVEEVKEWLRGLLAQIPLRHYRTELTNFILGIANAIRDADLDRYSREARAFLNEVESLIEEFDLAGEIQAGLQTVKDAVGDALSGVKAALELIAGEITSLADQASDVLDRASAVLETFQTTVEEVTTLLATVDFEQAGAQVVDKLRELRSTAEELLSIAPLPDSLRPVVDQLIQTLDDIDFGVVLDPVRDTVKDFDIPDEIAETIDNVLAEAGRLIANLITPELIDSIDAEIQGLVREIEKLDPSQLLTGVSEYIQEAAAFIETLDPRPIVAQIRGPFDTVLEAVDAVHPQRLLAPVIDVYNSLLSGISLPSAESVMQGASDALNNAGDALARQLRRPLDQLAGGGGSAGGSASGGGSGSGSSGGSGSGGSGSGGGSSSGSGGGSSSGSGGSGSGSSSGSGGTAGGSARPPQFEQVRAGDLIRMLGFLPAKLREGLQALDESVLGDVIRRIDSFSGGLARDLRRIQQELWQAEDRLMRGLDQMVVPLGDAQIRAQLAIRANFRAGNVQVDVNGAMTAVAMAGPGPLRSALVRELEETKRQTRAVIGQTSGSLGATLEHAATALERSSLARLVSDADGLLAALDPEPVAVELDELVQTVFRRMPELTAGLEGALRTAVDRMVNLLRIFNPINQAEKFFTVFDVIREELDLLNPRRLASELSEVHGAIRSTIAAYDPDLFAQELYDIIQAVAEKLRSLDPAALLGDLDLFSDITGLIESASPRAILEQLDTSLDATAERLEAIDLKALELALEDLPEKVIGGVEVVLEGVRTEVKALLESIKYATQNASASASVEVSI